RALGNVWTGRSNRIDDAGRFRVKYRLLDSVAYAVRNVERMTEAMQLERITHDPAVMGGKPCIRGLRVTVGTILGLLADGKSRERVLQAYPYLEPDDIDAALAYAAW